MDSKVVGFFTWKNFGYGIFKWKAASLSPFVRIDRNELLKLREEDPPRHIAQWSVPNIFGRENLNSIGLIVCYVCPIGQWVITNYSSERLKLLQNVSEFF